LEVGAYAKAESSLGLAQGHQNYSALSLQKERQKPERMNCKKYFNKTLY
jgi:hypothetical protein